jgi:hypothetical protein
LNHEKLRVIREKLSVVGIDRGWRRWSGPAVGMCAVPLAMLPHAQ